jgi:hypothetical protein
MGQFPTAFVQFKTGRLIAKQLSNWMAAERNRFAYGHTISVVSRGGGKTSTRLKRRVWVRNTHEKHASRLFALHSTASYKSTNQGG